MASTITRRPLPALVMLLALLALTGVVWWRVLHRSTDSTTAAPVRPTCAPTPSAAASATRTIAPPSSVTVAVLNSTQRSGIGAKARATLIQDGFKVPMNAANDTSGTIASTAQIRYGPADADAATLLGYYFPGATLVRTRTTSAVVTVSLGQKYTAVATPAAVSVEMARARVALARTVPTPSTGGSPTASRSSTPTAPTAASC